MMNDTTTFWIALVALVLGSVGSVLHFIAPRTKTTADDKLAAMFDELKSFLERLIKPAAILLVVACVSSLVALQACTQIKSAGHDTLAAVKDCSTPTERDAVKALAPAIDTIIVQHADPNGKVDWAPLGDIFKSLTVEYGGCVLAEVVAQELAPKPPDPNAPKAGELVLDAASLRAGFEQLRRAQFGGATFKLADGGTL